MIFKFILSSSSCKSCQIFIGNGRTEQPWIWNRAKATLLKLSVSQEKITEALDYYHAVEHISDLISKLRNLDKKQKDILFKKLKDLLWEGKLEQFVLKVTDLVRQLAIGVSLSFFLTQRTQSRGKGRQVMMILIDFSASLAPSKRSLRLSSCFLLVIKHF
jgi:hypothetical protein